MTILDEIISYKQAHLLKRQTQSLKALLISSNSPLIIGEIKRGSPSKGIIKKDLNIKETLKAYEEKGVGALSVLTDSQFFYGNFADLAMVRSLTDRPILCKDFIIDVNQIMNAYRSGADCILLIAKVLTNQRIAQLIQFAHLLDIEVLLEIKSLEEFNRIKDLDFDILGINNRNLETFETNLDVSRRLIGYIETSKPIISESGFFTQNEVESVCQLGFDGVLIGEALVTGAFKKTNRPSFIKICGVKDEAIIHLCHEEKVTHVGFVLSESKRQVSYQRCRELVDYTRQQTDLKSVAVLKKATHSVVNSLLESINPDYVQVHTLINDHIPLADDKRVIRVMTIENENSKYDFDDDALYLCDTSSPGTGKSFDWNLVKEVAGRDQKIIVAGGLDPVNVVKLIRSIRPYGVDVSSGVETNGVKDSKKIKQFIQNIKEI